jgi:hypothetical protein
MPSPARHASPDASRTCAEGCESLASRSPVWRSALTAGNKKCLPLDVGRRRNVVHHQQFANVGRGDDRNQGNAVTGGDRSSRELHPPCVVIFCERHAAQEQRDARRHEVAPDTRRSRGDGPRRREEPVMLPGRRHGFLPRSTTGGLRRIEGCGRLFELPAGGPDPRPRVHHNGLGLSQEPDQLLGLRRRQRLRSVMPANVAYWRPTNTPA